MKDWEYSGLNYLRQVGAMFVYGIRLYDSLLFRASGHAVVELVRRRRELLDDNVHLLVC